ERARGLGDDSALLTSAEGRLVVSTDVSVEAVHFRLEWMDHEEIGWRAAAAALSDLAAVGAEPAGLLAAVVVPASGTDPGLSHLRRHGPRLSGRSPASSRDAGSPRTAPAR